jgi:hypothetical protein
VPTLRNNLSHAAASTRRHAPFGKIAMWRSQTSQDALSLVLSALVVWAFVQLAGPYAVPVWPVAASGLVVAAGLLAWRKRERGTSDSTSPPQLFPFDLDARRAAWLLGAIALVALVVRLHGLLDRPAWDDEMWTLRNLYTSDWGDLLRIAFDDYWPPLHYLVLNTVTRIGDTGLFWLRGPSAVFGMATVVAMYFLTKELFDNRLAALAGTVLLAGTTTHVLYSQEARVYSMLLFFSVLSALFFYRSFWERRISPAFIAATVLLTYSHSFASWYFVAGQCAYVAVASLIWRDKQAFWKGFLSQLVVLLLWLPLVGAFAYSRLARDIVVPTYWATGPDTPPGLFSVVELYQALLVRSWAGAALMALLFGLAFVPLLRRVLAARSAGSDSGIGNPEAPEASGSEPVSVETRYLRTLVFLLCWISVPVLFSYVMSAATSLDTYGSTRYHLTVLPGLCLLATAGVGLLRSRANLAAIAVLLIVLPMSQLARHHKEFARDRAAMDEAAEIIRANERPDELIFVGNGFRAFAYYFRGAFPKMGSAQWDSLTAAYADLTDVYTMESVKRGDTYAHEKFTPRIRFMGWHAFLPVEERFDFFVKRQLDEGGFSGSYWMVMRAEGDHRFRAALERYGVVCANPDRYSARGLEIVRCGERTPSQLAGTGGNNSSR